MRIHDFERAPNARRVRAFVAEKGVHIEFVAVDLLAGEQHTAAFLARNPRAEVPVLELDDGTCIAESVAICRYLERMYPEPRLLGVDARDEARVEMWNRRVELGLFRHVADYFQHTLPFFAGRVRQVPAYAETSRAAAREWLAWLDPQLEDWRYLAGERYSIADITLHVALDLGTPTLFQVDRQLPNLQRWLADVSERPGAAAIALGAPQAVTDAAEVDHVSA